MTNEASECSIRTLGELRNWIAGSSELSDKDKAQLRSALKRTDELVGHGALDLAADPRMILAKLDQLSPAMVGLSKQAFANLKARTRKAFQLATPVLKPARSYVRLTGEWRRLQQALDATDQLRLSRFLRFSWGQSWDPQHISDAHIERFTAYLRDEAVVFHWKEVVRTTVKTWNRIREKSDGLALPRLTATPLKRTPYWIAESQLPAGLRRDLDAYISEISAPNIFGEGTGKILKPKTIEQHRHTAIALASALVASGEPLEALTSLDCVVRPARLKLALRFLYDRAGQKVSRHMRVLSIRARMLARWCRLPTSELEEIDKIIDSIHGQCPSARGMVEKNRAVVRHLEDPGFRDHLLLLPELLLKKAHVAKNLRSAVSYARAALAIELLLTCSMRRENLVNLKLDATICRTGSGADRRWVIELPPEDVKNDEPLRFQLLPETVQILERYLSEWRGKICRQPNAWLFPNSAGGPMDGRSLAADLCHKTKRELGVWITPHQFRHLSTELYLQANPEGLAVASLHLGHRDLNTTKRHYARSKQREATRRYQQHFIEKREGARRRQVRRRPQGNGPTRDMEHKVQ